MSHKIVPPALTPVFPGRESEATDPLSRGRRSAAFADSACYHLECEGTLRADRADVYFDLSDPDNQRQTGGE